MLGRMAAPFGRRNARKGGGITLVAARSAALPSEPVGVHWRNLFEFAPVSNGLNASDLVNRLLLGFALIELRQEVLQIAHFFDVVLKPSLAFSVREQKRTQ